MNKQEAVNIAKQYFPSYPSVNEFHVTTDGQVFEDAANAGNHAKAIQSADDKKADKVPTFITVTREECTENVEEKTDLDLAKEKVANVEKVVAKLTAALEKAAAKNKPAAQEKLDAANAELEAAQKALAALQAE